MIRNTPPRTGHNCSYVSLQNGLFSSGTACKFIQILLVFYWLSFLPVSDSYYSVYLVCGIFGLYPKSRFIVT